MSHQIVIINVRYQRERFKALEDHVSKLFEQREFTKEISESIVSFLHSSSDNNVSKILNEDKNVSFSDADEEIKEILKKEFKHQ